jgi:hypothetical protein
MKIRKMIGWCLILFAVINVLHAVHLHRIMGWEISASYAFITALLFTGGAAALWLNKAGLARAASRK